MTVNMAGGYQVKSGTLTGSAAGSSITGSLTNAGGTVDPGGTTGKLSISGDYNQTSGTLAIGVNFTNGTNSSLAVGGKVSLADTLMVNFAGGVKRGVPVPIITYGATAGTDFATLASNNGTKYVHVTPDVNNTYAIQIPKIQGRVNNINPMEGVAATPVVADFTDPADDPNYAGYTAQIDWGDGGQSTVSTDDGGIYPDGDGGWDVQATHTYADDGSYPVTVTVNAYDDPNDPSTLAGTATVADQPISPSGVNGSATVGVLFSGVVATLTDQNPLATAGDFVATIHWPDDGSTSAGTVAGPTGGPFTVSGSHTFQSPGAWSVGVSIQDASTMIALANPTIYVMPSGGGGGGYATAVKAPARLTAVHPARGGTNPVFPIPVPLAALTQADTPAPPPSPGPAWAPRPPAVSAPPLPPARPADAFDPVASYLAALAASDAAAGPLTAPLSGPDAYFASLS